MTIHRGILFLYYCNIYNDDYLCIYLNIVFSEFTVNAIDVEELRQSQRKMKKPMLSLPLITTTSVSGSGQDSDEDDDEVNLLSN